MAMIDLERMIHKQESPLNHDLNRHLDWTGLLLRTVVHLERILSRRLVAIMTVPVAAAAAAAFAGARADVIMGCWLLATRLVRVVDDGACVGRGRLSLHSEVLVRCLRAACRVSQQLVV